jgi:DMSO/TMAO reductase YedYZ molybdopterin-dependent catalytic subunit
MLFCWAVVGLAGCKSFPAMNVPPTPTPAPLHVTVTGLVDNPLTLTTANIGDFPRYERTSQMVCPDGAYETEEATWQGVLLSDLFEAAHIRHEAKKFTVHSDFDGYKQSFKLSELEQTDTFLAITKDNRPMSFEEGAPARIVAHEEWGFRWVRWVSRIEVTE